MTGNTFGRLFKVTSFGESHGIGLGVIIDGCPSGIPLSEVDVQKELDRRRPGQSSVTTSRGEEDKVEIVSGVFEGKTTGAPIAMIVINRDIDSSKYEKIKDVFRPGHADFTYFTKYGIRDYKGGGRASGRETWSRVAAGAVAKKILALKGVKIIGHTVQVGKIRAEKFDEKEIEQNLVRCADKNVAKKMEEIILQRKAEGNSIGGVVEVIAQDVPPGLGEPVFHKLQADLAFALMSIGTIRGIEIGLGFKSAELTGKEVNDEMSFEKGRFIFKTNHAGGIQGGISNGENIVVRIASHAPSSILVEQKTVTVKGEKTNLKVEGRHDPCLCPRIVPVAEAMVALALVDNLLIQNSRQGFG